MIDFDYILHKIAAAKLKTNPFKHIVIDDFIPEDYGRQLADLYPDEKHEYWTASETGKAVGNKMYSVKPNEDLLLPSGLRDLIYFLNGKSICRAMEEKFEFASGSMFSDPHLEGGGLHSIGKDGRLEVHADFNYHPTAYLHRRLNLLLYFNYDWKEEWGGSIDLWSPDMKKRIVSVPPMGGKCVVFQTDATSYHGHPYPLQCPEGVRRNSIALYYYTQDKDVVKSIEQKRKSTVYMHSKRLRNEDEKN